MRRRLLTYACWVLAFCSLQSTATPNMLPISSLKGYRVVHETSSTLTLVTHSSTTGTLYAASRRFELPPITAWLNYAALCDSNGWSVAREDFDTIIAPLMERHTARACKLRILIDPGHGGKDSGATSPFSGVKEKELTLAISKRVAQIIDKDKRHTVRLTRNNDRYVTLSDRTRLASRWNADIFISIHINSAPNSIASGLESYVLPAPGAAATGISSSSTNACPGNAFDTHNTLLGASVHGGMVTQTAHIDRGLKRARYLVLRNAPCPAVLVECGFLSSAADTHRLTHKHYLENVAQGIAVGINAYATTP